MSKAIKNLLKQLGAELKAKGYFSSPPASLAVIASRSLLFITFAGLFIGLSATQSDANFGAGVISCVFIVSLFALWLNVRRSGRTQLGDEEWAKIEGFKLFLKVTEKDRLAFTDAPAKTPQLFNALLPAAIALKVEKEWSAQFAGIDVSPAVNGWYGGYTGVLVADNFGSDFGSSFSSAVSSNFAGASGAGGAGGGGGGGGGGGW